jgi:hypothetical protein
MSAAARRIALTVHVAASVGWLGAVLAFLVLATHGLQSSDVMDAKASYLSMQVVTRTTIIPLCILSLVSGILQSLGTSWGLFRHYWVIVKLVITVACTALLWLHLGAIAALAASARAAVVPADIPRAQQVQMVVAPAAAVLTLLCATVLSIIRPAGLTPFGWRRLREEQARTT